MFPDQNLLGVEDDQRREEVGYYFGVVTKDQWDRMREQMVVSFLYSISGTRMG
jgi:hypothetical protein